MLTVQDSEKTGDHLLDKNLSFRYTGYKWVALALACMVMVGNYFSYDNPQALQDQLEDTKGEYKLTGVQFNLLYSVYSFPNIVLPLFGGVFVDKMGARIAILLFSTFLVFGQAIFTFGILEKSFTWMIIGRVVFGLGGECLSVAQSAIVSKWFRGKDLAFAFGLNISVARFGSSMNSSGSPAMAGGGNLWIPAFAGVILCIIATLCGAVLGWMDKESDRREGITFAKEIDETEQIQFRDIKKFRLLYWLLLTNCVLIYGSFFGFTNNGNDILVKIFSIKANTAGFLLTIVYVTSAIFTPIMGAISDKYGRHTRIMPVAIAILIAAHMTFAFTPVCTSANYWAIAPLALIGVFSAGYAAVIWPCIPLVSDPKTVGTAFGIVTAFQNGMFALNPLIMGMIQDASEAEKGGFFWSEIYLGLLGVVGFVFSLLIFINDKKTGSILWNAHQQKTEVESSKRSVSSFAN